MLIDHPKLINEIWFQLGMPAWIRFIPTYLELKKTKSVNICVGRAYREGFKAGAAAMKELATKAAETVIENERVGRN